MKIREKKRNTTEEDADQKISNHSFDIKWNIKMFLSPEIIHGHHDRITDQ